jgi:hypothetical protein
VPALGQLALACGPVEKVELMWNSWTALLLIDGFTGVALYLVVLEILLTLRDAKPVGNYVWDFVSAHRVLDVGLGLLLGAVLGHLLAKGPIPWTSPITWPWDWFR